MKQQVEQEVIKFSYVPSSIKEGIQRGRSAQAFKQMEKELSTLNVNRGGGKGSKGFIFESLHVAEENANNIYSGNGTVLEMIDNNGIADIKITYGNGKVEYVQAKCGYEGNSSTIVKKVKEGRYENQKILLDKNNKNVKKGLERIGENPEQSHITNEQVEQLAQIRKLEGDITGNVTAPITTKLHACSKIVNEINKAGVTSAKGAGAFAAGFSMGKQVYNLLEGESTFGEASVAIAKDTAIATATGYVTGATTAVLSTAVSGTAVGAVIANTSNIIIQTQLGATMVQIGGAMSIMPPLAASTFLVGLTIGVAMSTCQIVKSYLNERKNAKKINAELNRIINEALQVMEQERDILRELIAKEMINWDIKLDQGFKEIFNALQNDDAEGIARGLNDVLGLFNNNVRFKTEEEFNDFFDNPDAILML